MPIHLQNLIRVKIGHLIVEERYLVDDHRKEDPAKENETKSQARPELFPWILWHVMQDMVEAKLGSFDHLLL